MDAICQVVLKSIVKVTHLTCSSACMYTKSHLSHNIFWSLFKADCEKTKNSTKSEPFSLKVASGRWKRAEMKYRQNAQVDSWYDLVFKEVASEADWPVRVPLSHVSACCAWLSWLNILLRNEETKAPSAGMTGRVQRIAPWETHKSTSRIQISQHAMSLLLRMMPLQRQLPSEALTSSQRLIFEEASVYAVITSCHNRHNVDRDNRTSSQTNGVRSRNSYTDKNIEKKMEWQ